MKPAPLLLTCIIGLAVPMLCPAQPTITVQPQSQTNVVGTGATFTVTASGTMPLAYQWQWGVSGYFYDRTDCTNVTLVLTNVGSSDAGDYRVIVTNADGAITSAVAHLTVLVPPRITPTVSLQHTSVFVGSTASFSVTSSGTAPLSYQWRLDGRELLGQTNKTLTRTSTQSGDEGDYTVVVTNGAGSVISDPARLWVVPPISSLIRGNYTNQVGQRLPYFYLLPTNYNAARSYALFCRFHGAGKDVNNFLSAWGAAGLLPASSRLQATDPVILVFPTVWSSQEDWTDQYLKLTSGLLDQLLSQFNVDTNRVYVAGASMGFHAAWDLLGIKPGFFAAADVAAGWMGNVLPTAIKDVPLWVACSADDEVVGVTDSRTMVAALRRAGGHPIYTEYNSGGHAGGISTHIQTPTMFDWLLAQRRGVAPTNEPLLSITSPTGEAIHATGATNLNLGGGAAALGRDVTKVVWENTANGAKGTASGTNTWSATGVPLKGSRSNLIIVTATTTSWAPAYGGNTTFNDALSAIQSPLSATLVLEGTNALLNWTGGGPPYRVQRATDLAAGDWTDLLPNATPPVTLPLAGQAGFYRIVGQ